MPRVNEYVFVEGLVIAITGNIEQPSQYVGHLWIFVFWLDHLVHVDRVLRFALNSEIRGPAYCTDIKT